MSQEYTKVTLEKVEAAKRYIQKKYSVFLKQEKQKAQYARDIEKKMNKYNFSKKQIKQIKTSLTQFETLLSKLKRKKIKIQDFQQLATIGKGSFGEVKLCRENKTKQLVAIKRLSKKSMIQRKQINHVSLQRQILSTSQTNFVIQLKGCFQDDEYLYFVMEYLPGGDFMNLLIKQDILEQEACKFFMVQIILAVEYIHNLGYIHRDLKPDNILIEENGHIKLIDFGLVKYNGIQGIVKQEPQCNLKKIHKVIEIQERIKKYHKRVFSRVGTPEYIAPEVLTNQSYDSGVDWWSVGIIFYEMIFGFTPFSSDTPKAVCHKITNWKQYLQYPDDIQISIEARSLLNGLLCERQKRYTLQKIKNHRFFRGVNWNKPQFFHPPFIPQLSSQIDTSNFQQFPTEQSWSSVHTFKQKDYNFVNFDYKKPPEINVLQMIDNQIDKIRNKASRQNRSSNKAASKRLETSVNLRSTMVERHSSPNMGMLKRKESLKKKKCNNFLLTEPCENRIM